MIRAISVGLGLRDRNYEGVYVPAQGYVPGLLKHLMRLTRTFEHQGRHVPYAHVYARPVGIGPAPELEFIGAAESGPEGIACIDDVARAALLALRVYEEQGSSTALQLALNWLRFVEYMQEPDGRFTNFILDSSGEKNQRGRTSYPGGQWWTARAMWALAAAWRITGDRRYLRRFHRGRLTGSQSLKIKGLQALAYLELYGAEPSDEVRKRICTLCDSIQRNSATYIPDRQGVPAIQPWGYHQLQALARAGHLLSRPEYLATCESTVRRIVEPLVATHFDAIAPWQHRPQCAYDVSTLALGLEDLYFATDNRTYRDLALACFDWLYGDNPAGVPLYDPETGCCLDGITPNGTASAHCGAESAIEAGFMELARRRLTEEGGRLAREVPAAAPINLRRTVQQADSLGVSRDGLREKLATNRIAMG